MRPVAVGRRNWTFAGSDAGGERAAATYSLVETAKLHGLDPEAYLRHVLERIADHLVRRVLLICCHGTQLKFTHASISASPHNYLPGRPRPGRLHRELDCRGDIGRRLCGRCRADGIETACTPLPSEIIMPFAGYLASTGRFDLFLARRRGRSAAISGRPWPMRWGAWRPPRRALGPVRPDQRQRARLPPTVSSPATAVRPCS